MVKKLREETLAENYSDGMYDESRSEADSSTTNDSYYEVRNRWRSAEDVRKVSGGHQEVLLSPGLNVCVCCMLHVVESVCFRVARVVYPSGVWSFPSCRTPRS